MLGLVGVFWRVVAGSGVAGPGPWTMQGFSRMDRDLWDARDVAGQLVPAGSVFAFLAAHRQELFDDSFTADLFPSTTGARRCQRT